MTSMIDTDGLTIEQIYDSIIITAYKEQKPMDDITKNAIIRSIKEDIIEMSQPINYPATQFFDGAIMYATYILSVLANS